MEANSLEEKSWLSKVRPYSSLKNLQLRPSTFIASNRPLLYLETVHFYPRPFTLDWVHFRPFQPGTSGTYFLMNFIIRLLRAWSANMSGLPIYPFWVFPGEADIRNNFRYIWIRQWKSWWGCPIPGKDFKNTETTKVKHLRQFQGVTLVIWNLKNIQGCLQNKTFCLW